MAWTYYITDRKTCPIPLIENIRQAIEASVDIIQIREKDLPARELFSLAVQAATLARGRSTRVLVNDRLDVALAAGFDGVHLAQNSVGPRSIRQQLHASEFLIGVSTHSIEEIRQLEDQGMSFVTFGPVYYTPSKAAYGVPVGPEALREAVRASRIPVLALGGIDEGNYRQCLALGAAGIAAIRLFQNPNGFPGALVEAVRRFPLCMTSQPQADGGACPRRN
ncbi:MAG TPA: thiamine phosphate synthase [Terriglobia bacterium]|nr:thiamine phosphate synthase [Terriglobia bacterium]